MGTLRDFTPLNDTAFLEAAAQLIETGKHPIGGAAQQSFLYSTRRTPTQHAAAARQRPRIRENPGHQRPGIVCLHGVP